MPPQLQNEKLLAYLNDNAIPSEKSPFDHILYDSDVEERFAKRFEHDENVKVYVKLPSWFKIDTPIGSYPTFRTLSTKIGRIFSFRCRMNP
ncbi:hypothetical protein AA904_14905 [Geobacillus stearothermophilus]|nr:hypothetical protein AA904_14905 [Geobacillus stearothermophilus]KMY59676.1 hypothetical protein AA905_11420 [Geobacillus stearothermophilus]